MAKWDERFHELAKVVATWSKDPECQVGAVIVSEDKRQFSFGYNGFPKGIKDLEDRLRDKQFKNAYAVHAELNAILNSGFNVRGATLYCTRTPCSCCAKAVIQAGIAYVKCPAPLLNSSWADDNNIALALLKEACVNISILGD